LNKYLNKYLNKIDILIIIFINILLTMSFEDYESDDEEIIHGKYNLGLCEYYWDYKHGVDDSDNIIFSDKLLYNENISKNLFYTHINLCNILLKNYFYHNRFLINQISTYIHYNDVADKQIHSIIQNYTNIVLNRKNYTIDIVQKYKEGDVTFAIKKTIWLKIIQRKWKKYYQYKQQQIRKMYNPMNIHYRELNGKWPIHCRIEHFKLDLPN